MKGTGRMIKQMAKEGLFMPIEIFILETGLMTRPTGMASTSILTVPSMKVIGRTISSTVRVLSRGETELSTRGII